jgi:hypothetical protein
VWASAVLSQGGESVLEPLITRIAKREVATDAVGAIGKELSLRVRGIKGAIFRKSLEETLLEAVGLNDEFKGFDFAEWLRRFRDRCGLKGFIELFLSLYVFNTVWIEIQDSVRLRADDARAFEASMEVVERVCIELVRSEFQRWENKGNLDQLGHSAELCDAIMLDLEDRLLELAHQAPTRRQG